MVLRGKVKCKTYYQMFLYISLLFHALYLLSNKLMYPWSPTEQYLKTSRELRKTFESKVCNKWQDFQLMSHPFIVEIMKFLLCFKEKRNINFLFGFHSLHDRENMTIYILLQNYRNFLKFFGTLQLKLIKSTTINSVRITHNTDTQIGEWILHVFVFLCILHTFLGFLVLSFFFFLHRTSVKIYFWVTL